LSTCNASRARRLDRQREAAREVFLRVGQLTRRYTLTLQPHDLFDHQPQCFRGFLGSRVGFRDNVPGVFQGVQIRRGAVGEAALGAEHPVQAVAPFTAEDFHRDVQRQVVRMTARQRDVPGPDLRLCRTGPIDDTRPAASAPAALRP
jgi:hypothetical protein